MTILKIMKTLMSMTLPLGAATIARNQLNINLLRAFFLSGYNIGTTFRNKLSISF